MSAISPPFVDIQVFEILTERMLPPKVDFYCHLLGNRDLRPALPGGVGSRSRVPFAHLCCLW